MRRAIAAVWLVFASTQPVLAQDTAEAPDGYAFDSPRLLTQQLLWGLVHGVRLLASACHEAPDAPAIQLAYADWLDRNHDRIVHAANDLARHYYGRDAVSFEHLTSAMRLKTDVALREDELSYACSTFVDAVAAPRYDLDLFYRLRRDAARAERATAVRDRVAACLKTLDAKQGAALSARYMAWIKANETLEQVARSRLLALRGDTPDDRQWRRDAGAGAVPPAVSCANLVAALDKPGFNLPGTFEDQDR